MKKDEIDKLFDALQGGFDTETPQEGHRLRFLEKLEQAKGDQIAHRGMTRWWRPLAIAASIALICMIGWNFWGGNNNIQPSHMAEISPEIVNTQSYFVSLIEEEVTKLKGEETPETKKIIDDTLLQLKDLEADYTKLEEDLVNGGNQKMILSAMITNFQTRIDLLNSVLEQIDTIKHLNTFNDETITI